MAATMQHQLTQREHEEQLQPDTKLLTAEEVKKLSFDCISQSDLEQCKKAYEEGGVDGCREFLREKQESWKTVPLNVAIIGNSGVGKSSFINAIRDLTADDEGAAEVDVVEATMDIRAYPHPNNEMLKFWDLPGVGTEKFPKDKYLEIIHVDRYDFFLLMTASRFTENDTWLGNEITKRDKQFYFVRTKVGVDISSDRKAHPRTHREQDVLRRIQENIVKHLANLERPTQVFLVDSYKKQKYDFDILERCLIRDFPELKRSAMILSMCAFSEGMIKLKAKHLRLLIWPAATASCAIAVIPLPGVSLVFDTAITITMATYFYHQLGLDDKTLEKHAKITKTDPEQLKSIVRKSFGPKFFSVQGLKAVLQGFTAAATIAAMVVEEFSHFIPLFGSIIAAPLSFAGTFLMLKMIVDKMESVALQVVHYAAENSIADSDSDSSDSSDD